MTALHPLTISVAPGAVVLVEGRNGAGKSTLLRVAAGLLRPTSGTRHCSGPAIYLRPGAGGRTVERVVDAVRFAAAASASDQGRPSRESRTAVDEALSASGLDRLAGRRVGTLSAGERGRLSIALMLATRPALACLDEPAVHLDDDGAAALAGAVRTVAESGTAVLMALHDPDRFTAICDARIRVEAGRALVRTAPVAPPAREERPA